MTVQRAILLTLAAFPLMAQNRTAGANLAAAAPRVHGKPDLSGIWESDRTPEAEWNRFLGAAFSAQQIDYNDVSKEAFDIFWGLKPEEEPLQPAAAPILRKHAEMQSPTGRCLPAGVPATLFIYAFKMIQTSRELVVLSGSGDPPREIYTDGRRMAADPQPAWMGHSVGKWQGDALTIETTGFTEDSWFDIMGHPRSESARILETYRRRNFGHMDVDLTIEDPKYYTRPATIKASFHLLPGDEFPEYVCAENEKDSAHIEAH